MKTGRSIHNTYQVVKIRTPVKHRLGSQERAWRRGCSRTLLEFWLAGIYCVLSRKHSGPHRVHVYMIHTHTVFPGIWYTDWLVLHASFIILSAKDIFLCGGGGLKWNSPHQRYAVISCNAQDMPQLNGKQNCSREHYLQKVPFLLLDKTISTGVSPQWYGGPRGGGRRKRCNDESHQPAPSISVLLNWAGKCKTPMKKNLYVRVLFHLCCAG